MITSLSTNISLIQGASNVAPKQELNDTQKDYVKSVLENYDADSLSDADALEIVSNFSQAGITPSRDLANTISDAGFSAQEIGELAGVLGNAASSVGTRPAGGPPPPPSDTQEEEEELAQVLKDLLDASDKEKEEKEEFSLNKENSEDKTSFDDVLDLASKIVNLNDASKDKVLELFEKYNENENDLSKENVQKVVQNSLNQILGDTNNFTQTSFYA